MMKGPCAACMAFIRASCTTPSRHITSFQCMLTCAKVIYHVCRLPILALKALK